MFALINSVVLLDWLTLVLCVLVIGLVWYDSLWLLWLFWFVGLYVV